MWCGVVLSIDRGWWNGLSTLLRDSLCFCCWSAVQEKVKIPVFHFGSILFMPLSLEYCYVSYLARRRTRIGFNQQYKSNEPRMREKKKKNFLQNTNPICVEMRAITQAIRTPNNSSLHRSNFSSSKQYWRGHWSRWNK